jgi:hypothetical protein
MALAYQNSGDFAKAVYGDASSQHAGPSGSIAMANPSAPVALKGGSRRNKSQKNQKNQKNKNQKNKKNGGSKKNNKSQRNKNQKNKKN